MNQVDHLNRCSEILTEVLPELGSKIEKNEVNEIADLIIESMEGNYRYFHTFEHVLMVTKTDDPLVTLAGLFHDLIYIQVDQQIRFHLTPFLTAFIEEKNNFLLIRHHPEIETKKFDIVLRIFGLQRGDNLSNFSGTNEFLSALAAAIILTPYLPSKLITRLVTLIELTIPFRKTQPEELTITQQLEKRLQETNEQFNLGLTKEEIIQTVIQAVKLANADVSGFALENVEEFINNTWLLLPEANHCLISLEKSTVKEYCTALAKTQKFLSFVSPQFVFHCYHDQPSLSHWQGLVARCQNNLAVAKLYLSSIVVSLSIIDALCSRFCHHISLSFLFGFSPNLANNFFSIVDFLPSHLCEYQIKSDLEKKVLSLIQCQPKPDFFSTLQYSVLVDFVVSNLGFQDVKNLLPKCHLYIEKKMDSEDLLSLFPDRLINDLANSIALLLAEKQKAVKGKQQD